jgi:two-component system, LuxR family, sensor kinase FixL
MEKNETARENVTLRKRVARLEAQLAKLKTATVPRNSRKAGAASGDAGSFSPALSDVQARAEWFALFPESNPNPVVRVSTHGVVMYRNPAASDLPGWSSALGEPLPAEFCALVRKSMQDGQPVDADLRIVDRWYWVSVVPVPHQSFANVYGRDITSRKRAERDLDDSQEELRMINAALEQRNAELNAERARLQGVIDGIAEEVWVCDLQGRMTQLNEHVVSAPGLKAVDSSSVDDALDGVDVVNPDGTLRAADQAPLLRSLSGDVLRGEEMLRDRRTGRIRYRYYTSAPTRDAAGNITGAVAVARDITELKEAERALTASQNRMNDILRSIGDGMLAIDWQWNVIYVNRHAAQVAGKPVEEMVGRNFWALWPYLIDSPLESLYRNAMELGVAGQVRTLGVSTGRWYDVSVYPSSEGITIYYVDKTEQVQAEKARIALLEDNREQGDLLKAVFEADPSGIAVFTRGDLRIQFANRAYKAMLPIPGMEPVGRTIEEAWPASMGFHVIDTYLPNVPDGQPVIYEKISRRFPDGSLRHFSLHVQGLNWQGKAATAVVVWEITRLEEAKAEVERYAEQLARSNKDLQEFALIASHDLQEPLRKIEAFGSLLTERATGLDEHGREYVDRMRKAAGRMRDMVEGLLQLSRVTTQGRPFVPVNLWEIAVGVASDLNHQVRRTDGMLEIGALPTVLADPLQMRQLLQNLVSNALKYHRPGVPPDVKIWGRELAAGAEIMVQDNGIGFEQEQAERIFQPFQRLVTRAEYEGSGMGLAICRRIVERHGGEIRADSKPGEGTLFTVILPGRPLQDLKETPSTEAQS